MGFGFPQHEVGEIAACLPSLRNGFFICGQDGEEAGDFWMKVKEPLPDVEYTFGGNAREEVSDILANHGVLADVICSVPNMVTGCTGI